MARELRVGDRAQTPLGVGTIAERSEYRDACRVVIDGVGSHWWDHDDIWPLTPPDIPRERVADLHAAVTKRVEQLYAACDMTQPDDLAATCAAQRWSELQWVTEALRLLLEVDNAE